MAQDGPKMAPRWSQDGFRETPKLASRVSEVRILQKRLCQHRSTLQEAQSGPRTAQDGPRRAKMVPKWPEMAQDGPRMASRWSQDEAKIATKRRPMMLSDVAELHILFDRPKSSKLASRVGEVRFLAGLWSTFAVLQLHQNCPPLNPPRFATE